MDGNPGAQLGLLGAILVLAALGAAIGLLAGLALRGSGPRIAGDVAAGAVGSVGSGFLLPSFGIETAGSFGGTLGAGIVGAVVLIAGLGLLRKLFTP